MLMNHQSSSNDTFPFITNPIFYESSPHNTTAEPNATTSSTEPAVVSTTESNDATKIQVDNDSNTQPSMITEAKTQHKTIEANAQPPTLHPNTPIGKCYNNCDENNNIEGEDIDTDVRMEGLMRMATEVGGWNQMAQKVLSVVREG